MRCAKSSLGALVAFVLIAPPDARAETELGQARVSGEVEVGGRSTWGDDDEAKFLEYRDLDEGAFGSFDFLAEDEQGRFFLRGRGENPGYDDQRYRLEGGRYGVYTVDLSYGELPHVFSTDARTLFVRGGEGELLLPAGVQSSIAGAGGSAAQSAALSDALQNARPTDLGLRWLEGRTGIELRATESLTLRGHYRIQDKRGERAFKLAFGSPGGTFLTLPGPVDETIHEVSAEAEFARERFNLAVEYLGSFYENDLDAITADNPFSATDAVDSPSRGRSSLDPDNSAHNVTVSGGALLPVGFPARVAASFSYGLRLQNEDFLPFTVNSAITSPGLVLPRNDLDGEVQTLAGNVVLTGRPTDCLDLDLRYRVYDHDNRTDALVFAEHVTNDTSLDGDPRRSVHNDYTTHDAELDGRIRLSDAATAHLGYAFEAWHRSDDRQVEDLYEHGPNAKLDLRLGPATFQGSYRFRTRDGDGYDTSAFFDASLAPTGETPLLRKFDQADRDVHELRALVRATPWERLELTVTGSWWRADYDETELGLTEQERWNVGWEGWLQVHERVGVGAHYTFEKIRFEQDSRWRTRSFAGPPMVVDDPLNDWSSVTRDRFHTGGADVRVALLPGRLDLDLGYVIHWGRERTKNSGPAAFVPAPPPTTAGDGGNAVDWPEVEERLQAVTVTLAFEVSEALTLKALYRYEDYHVDDFRRELGVFESASNVDGSGTVSPSGDVFLGDTIDDYQAHVLGLSAVVRF